MKTVRFKYDSTTGTVSGPADYMASPEFQRTKKAIENGTHCLIGAFPGATSIAKMVEVIFQADFSAWAGNREILAAIAEEKQ